MSSVVISGDSSGTVTLTVPSAAGTNTATLPAATGTVMVSGNMPAFSVYLNANQSFTASTFTKVTLDVEDFDTNNNFSSSRFTPTVAGYYQISWNVQLSNTSTTWAHFISSLYKNGSEFKRTQLNLTTGAVNNGSLGASCLVYLNGSTDYVEIYAYTTAGGTPQIVGGNNYWTWMTGSLVRTA